VLQNTVTLRLVSLKDILVVGLSDWLQILSCRGYWPADATFLTKLDHN